MSASEVDRHVAQRYLLQRRLGKGAYGIVWKAVDRRTGEVVAIKKIFDAFRDKTDAQRTFREIMLLQEFGDHPNIIRLLDVIRAENDRDIYLVLESMDTDLNAVICKGGLLKDVHKRYIFHQLLRATEFIHSGHVIHRDQKPSNVLLDSSCLAKLCDFGLARSLSGLPEGPEGQALTEYVATRWYRAPEVLLSASRYTPGVDMWSLGCILGEMLRGKPLFPGTSTLHQLELILETIPPPSKEDLLALGSSYSASVLTRLGSRPRQTLDTLLPPDTPPEALDLLRRLLVFAPDKRLSAAQALRHPYVQRFHCPAREWTLEADVRLPVQEGVQLSAPEYRNLLYQMILDRRGNSQVPREEGLGDAPRPQAPPPKPGAVPRLASDSPAQNPGRRPRSGPGCEPAREALGRATSLPRQSSGPLLRPPPLGGPGRGERSPGATTASPSAPSWPGVRGAAPSLTSQAAAQVAIQALIRSDRDPGRGVQATAAPRVSPAPSALASLPVSPSPPTRGSLPVGSSPAPSSPAPAPPLTGRPTACRSPTGFPASPGPAGGCSAPRPRWGPRGPLGPRSGATHKPMAPSAARRWAVCPCSLDLAHEPPSRPQTPRSSAATRIAPSLCLAPCPGLPRGMGG
ncbi:mitogen-activated protein kinase 15 isoform X1 [Equus przewalskii]|uniref:Mitogen-activated protein kinase 15 isoform X1 n=1 Tax=Equus przewalskii TaxID=9798 RepID=A0ABM4QFX1_EQUPR|nr:mitogen-activated protein kinase 15 isoform X2 [Equus caballus]